MSRTRLTILTALALLGAGAAVFITRHATGGVDVGGLPGVARWQVTITARGESVKGKAFRVDVSNPPSFRHQQVSDEKYESEELAAREGRAVAANDKPDRKTTLKPITAPMAGDGARPYQVTQTFRCTLGVYHPNEAMKAGDKLDNRPNAADHALDPTVRIESNHPDIIELARELGAPHKTPEDQYRAFLEHVRGLRFRDTDGHGTALDCYKNGGDAAARQIDRLVAGALREQGVVGVDRADHLQRGFFGEGGAEPGACGRMAHRETPRVDGSGAAPRAAGIVARDRRRRLSGRKSGTIGKVDQS